MPDPSYGAVLARREEILRRAAGVDYAAVERGGLSFDYESLLAATGYAIDDVARIQADANVGRTPLLELKTSHQARA